ncbi:uncharacterized protein LOC133309079 [Gastrolobium bilobum]|uniref:uncharacterized protein LOC133309079 n=1 Tax=Gastrolobium bilobum TaxID=150636 RepID=UPI002AB04A79|nr:uncharacterized protein LOC133309079 [Gastrolobium bilobum]
MKWSELGGGEGEGCKEHPNNTQLPGVCSSCLRDKLSKLYKNEPTHHHVPSSSAYHPQPFSSATLTSSNYVSPAYRRLHRRHSSYVTDSVASMVSFDYGLKKSNSITFASKSRLKDREINGANRGSKKRSFWSKLLKFT